MIGHSQLRRRSFLKQGALVAGSVALTPLEAFWARVEARGEARTQASSAGYGSLALVADLETGLPLLALPAGFSYRSLGWAGDPLTGGGITPGSHDGTAAFAGASGLIHLVRNHEISTEHGVFAGGPTYDPAAGGGTTTLTFDGGRGQLIEAWPSLVGTHTNCAGGLTPWGSWLTCEEIVKDAGGELTRDHGYIFEVPVNGPASAAPLTAMGRFVHEAVAVDPTTGIVYETEDKDNCGFYRFVPTQPGNLAAGGRLQMMALTGRRADLKTFADPSVVFSTRWVDIDDPDPAHQKPNGVYDQGRAQGGAQFRRLEGAWYGNGRVYFVSTSGGPVKKGQVWEYHPGSDRLRLVFASTSEDVLDSPDNICVSPRGGLVLCEDGGGTEYVHGLTADGTIFRMVQNNVVLDGERNGLSGDYRGSEFTGACFSPDGQWLFVNVQSPGITFAITGPWSSGAL